MQRCMFLYVCVKTEASSGGIRPRMLGETLRPNCVFRPPPPLMEICISSSQIWRQCGGFGEREAISVSPPRASFTQRAPLQLSKQARRSHRAHMARCATCYWPHHKGKPRRSLTREPNAAAVAVGRFACREKFSDSPCRRLKRQTW